MSLREKHGKIEDWSTTLETENSKALIGPDFGVAFYFVMGRSVWQACFSTGQYLLSFVHLH